MRQSQKRSSSHNHVAQQDDAMDIDEQILNDVASLRASTWQASGVQPFEDTRPHADVSVILMSVLPSETEALVSQGCSNVYRARLQRPH
jgi:hypothetical protein